MRNFVAIAALAVSAKADWINTFAVREIKLANTAVQTETTYTVKSKKSDANERYKFNVELFDSVGSLKVSCDGVALKQGFDFHLDRLLSDNVAQFAIEFASLSTGSKIKVISVSGLGLEPFPATALELEAQKVMLTASLIVDSPIETEAQSTTVQVPSGSDLLSVTPVGVGNQEKEKVSFGPFSKKESETLKNQILRVHFSFNKALPHLESVVKTVDISHWAAAVSVNEQIVLWNKAASLEGEFSRVPHTVRKFGQQSPYVLDHSLFSIDAVLAGNIENIHYRDVIGNISSSNARREAGFTIASLRPRFPLLGGWKVEFGLMYSVPFSPNVLRENVNDGEYLLSIPLSHPFSNVFSAKTEIRVVLPSGASNIEISYPGIDLSAIKVSHNFGWLDTPLLGPGSGHTVVSFSAGPQFASGNKQTAASNLLVKYTLAPLSMYRAPLLLTLYIFVLFGLFILSRRLRLQISNPKEEEEIEIRNADHDVCQKISDAVTDLGAANELLLEQLAGSGKLGKPEIDLIRKEYLEIHEATTAKVETLTQEFLDEVNKTSRTAKIVACLKLIKDNATGLTDAVAAGKDKTVWESKLVEAELEINAIIEKVETGAPSTPPTGSGSRASPSAAPLTVRKRK